MSPVWMLTICLTLIARFFLPASNILPGSTCMAFCLCIINFWSPYLVSPLVHVDQGARLTALTWMVVPKRECLVERFLDDRAFCFLSPSSRFASWSMGAYCSAVLLWYVKEGLTLA